MSHLKSNIFHNYLTVRGNNIDNASDKVEQNRFDQIVTENYLSFIENNANSLLEIGCYKGYTIKAIKKYTPIQNIEGIELSNDAVEYAKKYSGINSIYQADAFDFLKQKENSYDVIIMKAVLEHINKDRIGELLGLINNALTEQGVVIIAVPNMDWIMANHERYMDFTHEVGFTIESLYDVMHHYFNNIKVMPMKYDFILNTKSFIRIKLFKPISVLFIKFLYKSIGQGAFVETLFDRAIMSVGKKQLNNNRK